MFSIIDEKNGVCTILNNNTLRVSYCPLKGLCELGRQSNVHGLTVKGGATFVTPVKGVLPKTLANVPDVVKFMCLDYQKQGKCFKRATHKEIKFKSLPFDLKEFFTTSKNVCVCTLDISDVNFMISHKTSSLLFNTTFLETAVKRNVKVYCVSLRGLPLTSSSFFNIVSCEVLVKKGSREASSIFLLVK